MTFSVYKNKATLEREAREAKKVQREREKQVAEQRRQQQKATSFRNVWTETDREVRAAQEAQEAKRLAPILKEQAEQEKLLRELRKVTAETLLSQPDPERYVEAASVANETEKIAFIQREYALFCEQHPDWEDNPDSRESLGRYFATNSIVLPSAKTIEAAANRLAEFGLIKTIQLAPPEPEPQPWCWVQDLNWDTAKDSAVVAGRNIETGEPASYTFAQVKAFSTEELRRFISKDYRDKPETEKPEGLEGMDLNTGEMRTYSEYEQAQMDAETFKKIFRPKTNLKYLIHAV